MSVTVECECKHCGRRFTVDLHSQLLETLCSKAHVTTEEERLLAQCFKVIGRDNMVVFGSHWRWKAQNEPKKLHRVLDELAACQREGKHIRDAGAYAAYLWGQFE